MALYLPVLTRQLLPESLIMLSSRSGGLDGCSAT
jgi:hypothetical protein